MAHTVSCVRCGDEWLTNEIQHGPVYCEDCLSDMQSNNLRLVPMDELLNRLTRTVYGLTTSKTRDGKTTRTKPREC